MQLLIATHIAYPLQFNQHTRNKQKSITYQMKEMTKSSRGLPSIIVRNTEEHRQTPYLHYAEFHYHQQEEPIK